MADELQQDNETTTTQPTLKPFELPRLDWYDKDGRIYKDAIIENLNALEAKLNELDALDAFDVQQPDIGSLSLEDVNLDSPDEKIVNLKSFIEIFDLVNYPVELMFSGTTVKKISFWTDTYTYITRSDIKTELDSTNKYLYYDFSDGSTSVSESATEGTESKALIGCYVDGRVINLYTPLAAKLNLMYLLGNMNTSTQQFSNVFGYGNDNAYFASGQQAGIRHAESKSGGHTDTMTFYEEGK